MKLVEGFRGFIDQARDDIAVKRAEKAEAARLLKEEVYNAAVKLENEGGRQEWDSGELFGMFILEPNPIPWQGSLYTLYNAWSSLRKEERIQVVAERGSKNKPEYLYHTFHSNNQQVIAE